MSYPSSVIIYSPWTILSIGYLSQFHLTIKVIHFLAIFKRKNYVLIC